MRTPLFSGLNLWPLEAGGNEGSPPPTTGLEHADDEEDERGAAEGVDGARGESRDEDRLLGACCCC